MAGKTIVIANWKMNPGTFRDAKKLFEGTKRAADHAKKVSVIVAPPAIFLRELASNYRGRSIGFAIQNAHFETGGAHTGEISMQEARDSKASYAIIGHAERRGLGETNEDTQKKVAAALAQKMIPILCVGETKRTASGEYFFTIKEQLRVGLSDVPAAKLSKVLIVYEPLWTIGGNETMKPRDMHEMSIFIKKTIVDLYGEQGHNVKILYGGSIDAGNAPQMLQGGDVIGLLIGRASTSPQEFSDLLQAINE